MFKLLLCCSKHAHIYVLRTLKTLYFCFPVNDQRDSQIPFYVELSTRLYMFRAHRAHHQERQIVSVQPPVAVSGRVVCRSEDLHTTRPSIQSDSYQRLY